MMWHLETVPFGEKKEHSVWCYVVFEIVTRTVGGMSKEIILFTTLLPVLTRYNVLRKFPLSLHAVSQWGGRESLPSQGFQLEIGNYKQVLDLPSIPQNLNPNYIKKQASKCSREKCSLQKLWANRLHMEILTRVEGSSDLRFWSRMVLSLSPAAGIAAGPSMGFSEKHKSWHLTTEWKCWICLLISSIQICVYFYPTSWQRKFWKYKLMKALYKKQFIYCLFHTQFL